MFIEKVWSVVVYFWMPVIAGYHLVAGSVFLNTAAEDAKGLEKLGNALLTPVHYLMGGKTAVREGRIYVVKQKFDYSSYFIFKNVVAAVACPVGLTLGSAVKGLAYFSDETKQRHALILKAQTRVVPHLEEYKKLGLDMSGDLAFIDPPQAVREPGNEHHLAVEKEALYKMVSLFRRHKIPYWLDGSSSDGACRYGGAIPSEEKISIAILEPDFENVLHLLSKLNPKKYQVQDWSTRSRPQTSLKLYIVENRASIDISILNPIVASKVFPLKKAYFDGIEVAVSSKSL